MQEDLVDDLSYQPSSHASCSSGESIVPSARSSATPGEAIGEIAAGMIDSMMSHGQLCRFCSQLMSALTDAQMQATDQTYYSGIID